MSLVVQKYGGTSLADADCIRRCAARAVAAHLDGHDVVVVVSAMGSRTDELLELARRVNEKLPPRELDRILATGEHLSTSLMAMAIAELGVSALSRSFDEIGIVTDSVHGNARIRSIDPEPLRRDLRAGRIPVVPGFLGCSETGELTTFGRGGSDTTAVAVAAALGIGDGDPEGGDDPKGESPGDPGGICEIYTDVDGVYTADPRVVPGARKLERLTYVEMVELASLGAGVLNPRAVLYGRRYGVPIHVRSSLRAEPGTMIVKETTAMERVSVVGCALTSDLGRITIRGLPNRPGVAGAIFAPVEQAGILVDDIMQLEAGDCVDVSFTVDAPHLADLKAAVQTAVKAMAESGAAGGATGGIAGATIAVDVGLAKVSAVGIGMRTHTGVAAAMFRALGDAGINIANITTSEIKISCLVPQEDGERALRVVHDAFGLARGATLAGAASPRIDLTEVKLPAPRA